MKKETEEVIKQAKKEVMEVYNNTPNNHTADAPLIEMPLNTAHMEQAKEEATRVRTPRRRTYERIRQSEIPRELIDHFAKDDYELRLIRHSIKGVEDYKNLDNRELEGYEYVTPSELPAGYRNTMKIESTRGGIITLGDLCLMKVDRNLRKGRREYFRDKTNEQVAAVDINVLEKKGFRNLGTHSKVQMKEPTFQD